MNKLILIVLLAVCIISAQAFVKRDAPAATTESYADVVAKEFQELTKKAQDAFNPENIKQNFNELVDKVNKAIDDLKPKKE